MTLFLCSPGSVRSWLSAASAQLQARVTRIVCRPLIDGQTWKKSILGRRFHDMMLLCLRPSCRAYEIRLEAKLSERNSISRAIFPPIAFTTASGCERMLGYRRNSLVETKTWPLIYVEGALDSAGRLWSDRHWVTSSGDISGQKDPLPRIRYPYN